ncbi:hypothetical protein XELAEV_18020083mg [Xenopus laevis]|uniref:Uncharacterized protein n=1 Tax=Xenopus laevis TaxID=8355 RepID=A0A974HQP5_XENLA|nr:hypothetical protein XELAEV_18020083mg [Xenopus laevis]
MAFSFSDTDWESDISEVFEDAQSSDLESSNDTPSLTAEFKKYKNLLIKQLRLRWEISSLENYIKAKMIPRGLRLKKSPSSNLVKEGGQTFCDKWNQVLSNCSFRLMQLMVDINGNNITAINKQVEDARELIEKKKEENTFLELNEQVKHQLTNLQRDIKTRKKRKFIRDTEDYKKGLVYPNYDRPEAKYDMIVEGKKSNKYQQQPSKNEEREKQGGLKENQVQLRDRAKWAYPQRRKR